MSKKYVKKPVVIDAIQWNGENIEEVLRFSDKCYYNGTTLKINTLEGIHVASKGDFIIKGIKGEFYPCKPDIFEMTYDDFSEPKEIQVPPIKSLHNTTSNGAKKNVKDIKFWGDGDLFQLISKASSEAEGWMKSTKAMEIENIGCVVQVTTQQRNPDGSYAISDAVTFVPNATIISEINENEEVISRKLVNPKKVEY